MAARPLPPDVPRFGFALESGGAIVGVLLLIYAPAEGDDGSLRCNVSSWYVAPAFRPYAAQLVAAATRRKDVTFVNISPAPHTFAAIEAQGFQRFSEGLFVAVPAFGPAVDGARVQAVTATEGLDGLPENALLQAHAAYGCRALVVVADDGPHPFVFLPFRIRRGRVRLPAAQLIHCRAVADFARFAGTLAPALLRGGTPLVLVDACGPIEGLRGLYVAGRRPKYFRGPAPPRLGDLAWTELALFGA